MGMGLTLTVIMAPIKSLIRWQIIRILRIRDHEALQVIDAGVLAAVNTQEVSARPSTILTISEDFQRLVDVQELKREFSKGPLASCPAGSPSSPDRFQNDQTRRS